MEEINKFSFYYENGEIKERKSKLSPEKVKLIQGRTKTFLTDLITAVIEGQFVGRFSDFHQFTTKDLQGIAEAITSASDCVKMEEFMPFALTEEEHIYSNAVIYSEDNEEEDVTFKYRYAMDVTKGKVPDTIDELVRVTLSAMRFMSNGPDHKGAPKLVQSPPKAVSHLVPDLKEVGEVVLSTFKGSLTDRASAGPIIKEGLEKNAKFRRTLSRVATKAVPAAIQVQHIGDRQLKIRNSTLKIPETFVGRKARSAVKNLMQVPVSDKNAMGYYAQSHYDGYPATGVVRKYMEFLQDFDYTAEPPVVRITSSDRREALALYNALLETRSEVLVVYEGSDTTRLAHFWGSGKILRNGIVPYPGNLFDAAFEGNLDKIYFYSTENPFKTVKQTPETLYVSNSRLKDMASYYDRYGYFSFYSDCSSLITSEEFNSLCELDVKYEPPKMTGFSPSCKVRKGWFRVTSLGPMSTAEAFNNVANGRLHYVTWLYRANYFCARGDPGHKYFVTHAPAYDWVTGDTKVPTNPRLFQQLRGVVTDETLVALKDLLGMKGEGDVGTSPVVESPASATVVVPADEEEEAVEQPQPPKVEDPMTTAFNMLCSENVDD